jgi:DNA primase
MGISRQVLDDIRERIDIVDLVGSYVTLKRAGTAFKGLCPFHKEKTPSFTVNPQRQSFHCFGCGKGGDVFTFVMEMESSDFMGAARLLAQRANVVLVEDEKERGEDARKDLLYRIHEEAARFYQDILSQSRSAEAARTYLTERQLGPEVVETFGLGYAPAQDVILRWAEKKGYSQELLIQAGLLARDEERGRIYDRFRDRLMFPIRDASNRVLAFSGRILPGDERGSKYLNSPETPIFRKSRVLYALDRARKPMIDSRTCVLCEGQIDVIRCHTAGITNAVAGLGTALTEEHARVIKRAADTVILVMDADTAGQNSALRSAGIFLAAELSVKAVALPTGEDPDSLIVKRGGAAMQEVLAKARGFIDFQIDILALRDDLKSEAGFRRVTRTVLETIQQAESPMQRDQLLREAAHRLGVGESVLREDMNRMVRRRFNAEQSAVSAPDIAPAAAPLPVEERALAHLLMHHPEAAELVRRYLNTQFLNDADGRVVIELLLGAAQGKTIDLAAAARDQGDRCLQLVAELTAEGSRYATSEEPWQRAAQEIILAIRRRALERKRRELTLTRDQAPESERAALDSQIAEMVLDLGVLRRGWDAALPLLELDTPSS